jgi:hypothetical protein
VNTSNAVNAALYEKLNFNFLRDIAPVVYPHPERDGSQPVVSGQNRFGVYCLCEGRPALVFVARQFVRYAVVLADRRSDLAKLRS